MMNRPIVENVAAAMPRLEAFRRLTEGMVSLGLTVTLYSSGAGKPTVEWEVYSATRGKFYKGATLDMALKLAEGIGAGGSDAPPSDVVVPALEDRAPTLEPAAPEGRSNV